MYSRSRLPTLLRLLFSFSRASVALARERRQRALQQVQLLRSSRATMCRGLTRLDIVLPFFTTSPPSTYHLA